MTAVIYMVLALILFSDKVSGSHFNPAVSTGVFVANKNWGKDLIFYLMIMASQFVGGLVGAGWAWLVMMPSYLDGKNKLPDAWIAPLCPVGVNDNGTV